MPSAPLIRVDLGSPLPAYRQIVDQIRTLVLEKGLIPGTALPSVRRLAIDLGIHFNTVAEAYRTLAEEGWIHVSHGRAAVVAEHDPPSRPDQEAVNELRERLRHLIAEMRATGLSPARINRELRALTDGLK
jgi:GntR family transcriptional regulator